MPIKGILDLVTRRVLLAAAGTLIFTLIVLTVSVLALLRKDALEQASRHLGNLALVTSSQLAQSLQSLDLIVSTTVKDLEGRHAEGRALSEDRGLLAAMRERVAALIHARALVYIDHDGNLLLNSRDGPAPAANFRDREYFRVHQAQPRDGLHVGEPVSSRITGERVQVFSRRVQGPDGSFLGVVAGTVRESYFAGVFATLGLGTGGRVFLFRDDGRLLLSHPPHNDSLERSFAETPLFREVQAGARSGTVRGAGLIDAQQRIIAYQRVNGRPLVLAVSVTEEAVLAGWRRDAWQIGAGAAAAAVFIGLALFLLLRQLGVSAVLQHDLLETGERLKIIIQSAMDAIITVDENQRVVMFNAAAENIFGCASADAVGGPLDRFIPARFRAAHREHVRHFGETGTTTRMMGARLALTGLRADGQEFPIDASISQVSVDGRKLYTVILRDISARKAAEDALRRSYDELRELSSAMHDVREAERLRIARELHDELAQWLTALKMDVSWLSARLPREHEPLVQKADKMKGLVDTTVAAVRRIAADLRPVMLDDLGLVAAMESLLHDLSERTGIVVSLDADPGGPEFREPLASGLYRIAQEALTNVARHAQATQVEVVLRIEGGDIVLAVRDNGRGYNPEAAGPRKSYGVMGMRERAHTLGGTARVERLDTGGTLVEVRIPVARYHRQEAADDTGTAG